MRPEAQEDEAGGRRASAAAPAPATSLAPYRESVAEQTYERCPRKLGWMLLNTATGQVVPARCKAHKCPYCLPLNARLVSGALALAKPTRAVRLSLVGDDWTTARNRIKQLTHKVRKQGYDWNIGWHREPNPKGTGHHVHAWQKGSYVPQNVLQDACSSVGLGIPYIEKIKQQQGSAITYGLKGITYGLKMVEAEEQSATYLDVNGGRIVHSTRGYWLDEHGNPVGLRDAMAAAARVWSKVDPDEGGQWVLTREPGCSV